MAQGTDLAQGGLNQGIAVFGCPIRRSFVDGMAVAESRRSRRHVSCQDPRARVLTARFRALPRQIKQHHFSVRLAILRRALRRKGALAFRNPCHRGGSTTDASQRAVGLVGDSLPGIQPSSQWAHALQDNHQSTSRVFRVIFGAGIFKTRICIE